MPVPEDLLQELLSVAYLFEQEKEEPPAGEEQQQPRRFRTRHPPSRFKRSELTRPTAWQPPATAYKYTASVRLLKQRTIERWQKTRGDPEPGEQILVTTEELMHVMLLSGSSAAASFSFGSRWA